ncbi:MAG: Crp/Fnr family transcriptional regulator [Rhodospirillaceae bacterium]|nr:Crp/Fnr family transcriptional regulator [Rhodospirillaceae bacterium]
MDLSDKAFERKSFEPNAMIFQSGDRALSAFVVLKGDVDIIGVNEKGEMITYTVVKRGEMFGELALMQDGAKRTASAITKSGCEVMTVSREKVTEKMDRADPFLKYWIKYLSDRVIDLSKRVQK